MANMHTMILLENYEEFILKYNKNTIKGDLVTLLADAIHKAKENLEVIDKNAISSFIMSGLSFTAFFVMAKFTGTYVEPNPSTITQMDTLLHPLLITLFFSVGIAFYFSLQFIQHSLFSTNAEILALIEPFAKTRFEMDSQTSEIIMQEIVGSKIGLIVQFTLISLKDYYLTAFNLTYYFGVFGFLVLGILIKNMVWRHAFLISGILAGIVWIFDAFADFIPMMKFN